MGFDIKMSGIVSDRSFDCIPKNSVELSIRDPVYWDLHKSRLSDIAGYNYSGYSDSFLLRKIKSRMRSLELYTIEEYMKYISSVPEEKNILKQDMSVHLTHFFRNAKVYDSLRRILASVLNGPKNIRIWSVGCASGEEPYSLSILLHDLLGPRYGKFNISILATDKSETIIDHAKKGIYDEKSLIETSDAIKNKYFDKIGKTYQVIHDVKQPVNFKTHDILEHKSYGKYDMIVCRNTLIYFGMMRKQKIFMDFHNLLKKDGYLVLGMTERIFGPATGHFNTYDNIHRIYRKV